MSIDSLQIQILQAFLIARETPVSAKKSDNAHVTRIKAGSSTKKTKSAAKTNTTVETSSSKAVPKIRVKSIFTPFIAIGAYVKGAWVELKQVRWPTRQATWSLTGAVLAFTAFFVVLILLLDAGFKLLFEQLLG